MQKYKNYFIKQNAVTVANVVTATYICRLNKNLPMKNENFSVKAECYKNKKGKWNFRIMISVGNFKPKFVAGSNQGYENKKECFDIAGSFTYKGVSVKAIETKYRRIH